MRTNAEALGRRIIHLLPQAFAAAATGLGCLALFGWISGHTLLASFGEGLIPMAPSSALLFFLLGLSIFLYSRFPLKRGMRVMGITLGSLGGVSAVVLFVLSSARIYTSAEQLGISIPGTLNGVPIGHISPVTALACALIALSFLGTISASPERRGRGVAVLVLASILTLTSGALVFAYLWGTPLMYGGGLIPPSLPTSIGFLLLVLAILFLVTPQLWRSRTLDETNSGRPLHVSLLIFVLLSSGILIVGYVYHRQFAVKYRVVIEHELTSISDLRVSELEHWREERLGDASVFYRNTIFSGLVERSLHVPAADDARADILAWFRQVSEAYEYDRLSLYDTALIERLSYPAGSELPDSVFLQHAALALRSREMVFQDFYRDEHTDSAYLNILVPILDTRVNNRVIGMVAMRIDPDRYLFPLLKLWPTPSRTAETLLIRREGEAALFLSELRFSNDAAVKLRIPLVNTDVGAVKAVLGQVGISEGRDYRGEPVISNTRPVPNSPWFLVARIDLSEANAPVTERLWLTVFLMCALLLGGGSGLGFAWRQQKTRFTKDQVAAERERAWLHDIIARSLNDIYVLDPVTFRFLYTNTAAQRNGGYTKQELSGLTALDIKPEYTVHSFRATAQPLLTGREKVLVVETVHRRKDGTRYPVESHLQLVERPEGAVLLEIATDITERKQAEEVIRESEERFRMVFDHVMDGLCIYSEDPDLSKRRLVECNDQYAAMAGRSREELLQLGSTRGIQIMNDDTGEEKWRESLSTGTSYRGSFSWVRPDGKENTVEYVGMPITWRGKPYSIGIDRDVTERNRSQHALSESERRFHQLFDEAPVGYHEIDTQGRVIEVNRTELEMLGYTAEEMLHHPVWDFVAEGEASRDAVAAKIAGTLPSDRTYERTFRRKDGTTFQVLVTDRTLWNGAGEIAGIRSTIQDISELKRAEGELRLMAQTVESARDCISITDLENRFIFVNAAFQRNYGYTTEELLGKDVSVLRSPLSPEVITEEILHDTPTGGWHGELLNRRKDGSDLPVELWTSVVRDSAGVPVAMVGVARNITNRKASEEQARQSEEQFRLISENIADMIAVVDLDGKRIYNSPSYRSILGDPDSLKGTDGFHEIHPDDVTKVREAFQETVRTGIGQRLEYRFLLHDGSVRTIDSKGSVIRDRDGKVSQVIVVSRDVTEEKMLEAQFLRAQRMESIGTLAGGIAHDLNNVLAPIMMAIEVLRSKISDQGGQRVLSTIETSAKRGADIVRQVLAFGRGVEGERILVQLKHVVNEVVKIAGVTFPKSITVKTDIPRDLWTVLADPTQMHQVLLNMLVNARDAMPRGGTLAISAENVTLDKNYSRMHLEAKPGMYVSLSIIDTGTGIPPEIQAKIFEPFFTTKAIGTGTGLGLSTTIAIVKSHEGFITLDSEMGKGTTFRIYIPATGATSGVAAAGEDPDFPVGHGEQILIIDDEAAIREITRETLEAYGYTTLSASDGAEGIAIFAENKRTIKAVITDIMMPVMDGTAAILALKRIQPDVKIIAASGLTTRSQIANPSESHVQAFLTKPYTAENLLKVLAAVLR